MQKMPLCASFQTWYKKYSYAYIGPIAACCIPQRYVFALMGFLTVIIGTMMRLSLDLTFPHIATANFSTPKHFDSVSCPEITADYGNETDFLWKKRVNGTYNWDDAKQSSILQAYSFTYLMVQPIMGMLSDKIGGKSVLGYSLLVAAVTTIFTPLAAVHSGVDGILYTR